MDEKARVHYKPVRQGCQRPGMVKRTEEKIAELLAEHEAEPLSEAQEVEMRKVIRPEERG